MSSAVDLFLSAASEDALAARELADALAGAGFTCAGDARDGSSREELAALETARGLVLVLSAAANATPDIVRELERAAARGIPIIPYAIQDVSPSPSIAYFTATIPPIPAWSADRQPTLRILVEAARRALKESVATRERPALSATRYSKARYGDGRALQTGVAILLVISAGLNAYALYRDAGFLWALMRAQQGAPSVTAQDHLGWTALVSSWAVWTVIVSTILVFRRARLNLLSSFGSVRLTAREIVWRPIAPFANGVWMPRMARDLRASSSADASSDGENWPLARGWGVTFSCAYLLVGIRDFMLNTMPQYSASILGVNAALDLSLVVSTPLTYTVLSQVLDAVRARHRSRLSPQASTVSAADARDPAAAETSSTGPDVLVLHAAGDETIAASLGGGLSQYQCRCWTLSDSSTASSLAAADFAGFAAVLVVVSRTSHASEAMTALVRSALDGSAPVIPFVVDPPPMGSPLGHYIRSLHWIDGAAGPAALRSDRVRTVLSSSRVDAGVAGVTTTPLAGGVFSPLHVSDASAVRYRSAKRLRAIARALAIVQAAAAAFLGLLPIGVILDPDAVSIDAPIVLSAYLAVASLPAWFAFLIWIRTTHNNARALRLPGLESRAWLSSQVGVPVMSLVLGGRAIGRLWTAVRGSEERKRGWKNEVARYQVAWTAAGFIWTTGAMASAVLGAQGAMVMAMIVSEVQCLATITRGLLRARIIKDAGSRLDDRARREWQIAE